MLCLQRVGQDSESALRGAVEVLITEVFGDTERNLAKVRSQRSARRGASTLLVWSACLVRHSVCSCVLTDSSSWCSDHLQGQSHCSAALDAAARVGLQPSVAP